MSKSLNKKILATINQREIEEMKRVAEFEKEKINASKASIMNAFIDVLKDSLSNLEDYCYHKIKSYSSVYMPYKFEDVATELNGN